MIKGVHAMFYTDQADELRAFIRDRLRVPHTDVGGGWLIFSLPEADLGCHPVDDAGRPPTGTHDISFTCDDIEATVAELRSRGVEFTDDIVDRGYGLAIHFTMPGNVKVELFQPQYDRAPG
jgi:catechol 2,3-dioxygenase-like lactoylglutathione lyase family enzyme